ncbi:unnamed protein product, partial [marine sediment metagenome]
VDFSNYKRLESSKEKHPSGRVDRTFTYERTDAKIGKGRYRLRLTVAGDRLTEVTHFVHVPEKFENRYKEMRSANETLASVAQTGTILLYWIGACALGFLFLLRKRWLLWRMPLLIAFLVSCLDTLSSINMLPLSWMHYETAMSKSVFLTEQLAGFITSFFSTSTHLFVVLMMAESLSRCAFPQHLQLWRIWSRDALPSLPVLGRTIAGYLLACFKIFFQVLFFIITTTYFGWWTPADVLLDPNVLATYLPWLDPIASSLSAGLREEC